MSPAILIIEPRPEVANALAEVVSSANYSPVVRPYLDTLQDVAISPAAIVLRVVHEGITEPPHACLERLTRPRPPVVAIAWEAADLREAERLGCDVVLHAPADVPRLYDALSRVIRGVGTP